MMDADGTEKRQLTDFNTPGSNDYIGSPVYAGLVSFNPDGRQFVGDVQTNLTTQVATILIVNLNLPTVGVGTGLTGTYYQNTTLSGPSVSRVDPTVNFLWGFGPPAPSVTGTGYSVEWTGELEGRYSGPNTIYLFADSQVSLWVNGQLVISGNSGQYTTTYSATLNLVAGQMYSIRLDYQHPYWWSAVTLSWSSPGQPETVIPKAQLYPATVPTASALVASAPAAIRAAAVPAERLTRVARATPKVIIPTGTARGVVKTISPVHPLGEVALKRKKAGRS
jgi:hypothetical protein